MKPKSFAAVGAILLLALMPFFVPWSKVVLTIALSKGLAVLGILVLLRSGQVSFGQAMFFATGAYTVAYMTRGIEGVDVASVFVAGTLMAGVLGVLVGLFVARYRYIFFGMLNLAFSMVLYALLEKFYHWTGGSDGLSMPRPEFFGMALERAEFETYFFYFMLLVALVLAYAVHRYLKTPLGQALGAVKTNETRVLYLGVSPYGVLLVAYVIAALLTGVGGSAMAIIQGVVTPEYGYWVRSGELVFIAILGGAGHVAGAFAGALVYEVIRMSLAAAVAGVWQLLLGTILLIIILVAPAGLVGIFSGRKRTVVDDVVADPPAGEGVA